MGKQGTYKFLILKFYLNLSIASNSSLEDFGPSPVGFQSLQLNQSHSRITPNAWVIFPGNGLENQTGNFTAQPVNFSQSVGSKLRHSFAQINQQASSLNSETPVQSIISGEALLKPDQESSLTKTNTKDRNKKAMIAGASVATGAVLFATILVGGTFLVTTNTSPNDSGGSINNAGLIPIYDSGNNNSGEFSKRA